MNILALILCILGFMFSIVSSVLWFFKKEFDLGFLFIFLALLNLNSLCYLGGVI